MVDANHRRIETWLDFPHTTMQDLNKTVGDLKEQLGDLKEQVSDLKQRLSYYEVNEDSALAPPSSPVTIPDGRVYHGGLSGVVK